MSLKDLINDNTTDKNTVHSYLDTYEELFESKKHENINVLEIGIHYGGSIKLWRDYFTNAQIYGVDVINESDGIIRENSILVDPHIKLLTRVNAYDHSFINFLKSKKFDILIDDGPHTFDSVVFFVQYYLPLLNDGGVMVIEDIQHWDWIDKLSDLVPNNLKDKIRVYDLRKNKNRYDDILFVVDLRK